MRTVNTHANKEEEMFKNNLRVLMAQEKINITQLSKAIGISRNTLTSIYHEKTTRVDIKTLTLLCNYFECTPNDLIVITKGSD
ncbi:helix-turn-helix transcriptional regulator [Lysinibacillus sphaericus]|uniref:helix-turn-helix domain-containing protein n=1 Tax=Lysinibacillus sphaericus TaxID=1421 RepID=UPI002FBE7C3E